MPNVIAIFSGHKRELGGCEIYRTTMPFYYLQEKYPHWRMTWAFIEDIVDLSEEYGQQVNHEILKNYELFVFPRIVFTLPESVEAFQVLIDGIHAMDKRAIYELDDDLSNDHRVVSPGNAIIAASMCDAITVTTPFLRDLMEAKTGRKAYVLPNMISPEVWLNPKTGTFRHQDKLVLGLTGSPSHHEDWRVLETVLPEIMQNEDLHLIMMGYHPDYLADLPNTTYLPGLPYENYAQIIQACDIILAPVNYDPFNLGKSPIKCIEGMAALRHISGVPAGAACIATLHPIYQLAITSEKNGLLVEHTPEAWTAGLERLISDQALRHRLQVNGHQWVLRHHDIDKKISLWGNAYQAVLNRPLKIAS